MITAHTGSQGLIGLSDSMSREARAIGKPVITVYPSSYTSCAVGPFRILPLLPHWVPMGRGRGGRDALESTFSFFLASSLRAHCPYQPVAGDTAGVVSPCQRRRPHPRLGARSLQSGSPRQRGSSWLLCACVRVCASALQLMPIGAPRLETAAGHRVLRWLAAGQREAAVARVSWKHGPGGLEGVRAVSVRLQDSKVRGRQEQEGGAALPGVAAHHPVVLTHVSSWAPF